MQLVFDRVKMELSLRQAVPTETVRVHVEAVVASAPEQAPAAPELIRSTLSAALPAEWTTSFASRKEDHAGMEQIILQASTRVPEAKTAGLSDRLRKASRSGMSLKLKGIEFRPPQKTIDETARTMRGELYRMAQAEADLLNQSLPSDTLPWRIGSLTITRQEEKPEERREAMTAYSLHSSSASREYARAVAAEAAEGEAENLVAGLRLTLRAELVLHRLAVLPKKMRKE